MHHNMKPITRGRQSLGSELKQTAKPGSPRISHPTDERSYLKFEKRGLETSETVIPGIAIEKFN